MEFEHYVTRENFALLVVAISFVSFLASKLKHKWLLLLVAGGILFYFIAKENASFALVKDTIECSETPNFFDSRYNADSYGKRSIMESDHVVVNQYRAFHPGHSDFGFHRETELNTSVDINLDGSNECVYLYNYRLIDQNEYTLGYHPSGLAITFSDETIPFIFIEGHFKGYRNETGLSEDVQVKGNTILVDLRDGDEIVEQMEIGWRGERFMIIH